jgi:hypothetical protein
VSGTVLDMSTAMTETHRLWKQEGVLVERSM